ncbi:hypothetical protein [Bosea sp. (in: a-proteobacteria)]|uniref:hypothetical protein n=1 Tax=Bosea sp. (in: a-proteobacteria) TaxID=1871050 RepID=UPI00261E156B|nr:hypothetical protein [Bosea sp. (in: a-proteobacteria)]MCO5089504.1 hypothetical protein [Bosea sp. (in: a-proteobacteria)]
MKPKRVMMVRTILAVGFVAVALAGCQTTKQASEVLENRWIGQPADAFFVANGPPASEFTRDTGGAIYTWRGGEATSHLPAQWQMPASKPANRSQSAFSGFNPQPYPVLVQPARRIDYYCEAQIVADASGVIENIRISRDTDGRGLSFSRCAEVFSR